MIPSPVCCDSGSYFQVLRRRPIQFTPFKCTTNPRINAYTRLYLYIYAQNFPLHPSTTTGFTCSWLINTVIAQTHLHNKYTQELYTKVFYCVLYRNVGSNIFKTPITYRTSVLVTRVSPWHMLTAPNIPQSLNYLP